MGYASPGTSMISLSPRASPTLWRGSCSHFRSATLYRHFGPTGNDDSTSSCERSSRQVLQTPSQVTCHFSFISWSCLQHVVWRWMQVFRRKILSSSSGYKGSRPRRPQCKCSRPGRPQIPPACCA